MTKRETKYKIEYGVTPSPKANKNRGSKYPFGHLSKPGASFFVPASDASIHAVRSAATYYKKVNPGCINVISAIWHVNDAGIEGTLVMKKLKKKGK